jgi:hypothetical protein
MTKRYACCLLVLIAILGVLPIANAKTHKDNYSVSCDVLWPAVKDAVRNSGKYGILGIDNNEMSISYVIGGTLGGKRINSVVLNRNGEKACEMQTQTAYSGLIHNDAGDFRQRVDASLAKLASTPDKTVSTAAQPETKNSPAPTTVAAQQAVQPELKLGQTQEEVEKLMGKPQDKLELKGALIYIYPTCKVIFEKGEIVEVKYPDAVGK